MIYSKVAWVLVSSRTQIQPQVILDPEYPSISYDYGVTVYYNVTQISSFIYAFKVNESHIEKYIENR